MITPELPSRNLVGKDVILRYKDRVQKGLSFFDLNEAIFFYRKIGWYHEDLSSLHIFMNICRDEGSFYFINVYIICLKYEAFIGGKK